MHITENEPPMQYENNQKDEYFLSSERALALEQEYRASQEEPSAHALPPGFLFEDENLVYQPENSDEMSHPIFICSRLEITALTRDQHNQNYGRLLEFRDPDGNLQLWAMPMELLAGDGSSYRAELLSRGLQIAPGTKARQLLTIYIQSSKPKVRARCVSKTGWHKDCFVFPDQTIGIEDEERLILQTTSSLHRDYSLNGSLQDWISNVSLLCSGNSRLIFAISASLSSCLLNLLDMENGGLHYRGPSSIGKTTALKVAAAVWGSKDYLQRWRATINGIEALALWHNDTTICLDEISQVDPSLAGEIAYMLANGSAKNRADRHGQMKRKETFRIQFISSGEISLPEHMQQAGHQAKAGQEVRVIDIPADTGKFGIFENLHGFSDPGTFADVLKDACHNYYGIPGRSFVTAIIKQGLEEVKQKINESIYVFLKKFLPKESDGQVRRVLTRFAFIASTGEVASVLGITGWDRGDSTRAALACANAWLESRGHLGPVEEKNILYQVKKFFELHGESRFSIWDNPTEYRTNNRAGFRKEDLDGNTDYYVFPEVFKTEICRGLDLKYSNDVLTKRGWLMRGSQGEATSCAHPPGERKARYYKISSKVLSDEEL